MSTGRDWQSILAEHQRTIAQLADATPVLEMIAAVLCGALRSGRRVFVLGNGGSAADAQHIAGELLGRFKRQRAALPVVALTTDTSTLTAVANDLGYEHVFSRQIEGLAQAGDVVWILSTSGNSPNVLAAARAARRRGAVVIGFSGQTGGELASQCDYLLCVPHTSSDRIQEAHQVVYHYLCEQIEAELS